MACQVVTKSVLGDRARLGKGRPCEAARQLVRFRGGVSPAGNHLNRGNWGLGPGKSPLSSPEWQKKTWRARTFF